MPNSSDTDNLQQQQILHSLNCPIGLMPMEDPVVLSDGHTYDRGSAKILLNNGKSPLTRENLNKDIGLVANKVIGDIIAYLKVHHSLSLEKMSKFFFDDDGFLMRNPAINCEDGISEEQSTLDNSEKLIANFTLKQVFDEWSQLVINSWLERIKEARDDKARLERQLALIKQFLGDVEPDSTNGGEKRYADITLEERLIILEHEDNTCYEFLNVCTQFNGKIPLWLLQAITGLDLGATLMVIKELEVRGLLAWDSTAGRIAIANDMEIRQILIAGQKSAQHHHILRQEILKVCREQDQEAYMLLKVIIYDMYLNGGNVGTSYDLLSPGFSRASRCFAAYGSIDINQQQLIPQHELEFLQAQLQDYNQHKLEFEIINLCAHLAAQHLSIDSLLQLINNNGSFKALTHEELVKTLKSLAAHGIIAIKDKQVTMETALKEGLILWQQHKGYYARFFKRVLSFLIVRCPRHSEDMAHAIKMVKNLSSSLSYTRQYLQGKMSVTEFARILDDMATLAVKVGLYKFNTAVNSDDYQESCDYYNFALEIKEQIRAKAIELITIIIQLSKIYNQQGNYQWAIDQLQEALEIAEKNYAKGNIILIDLLIHIGITHGFMGNEGEAGKYLKQAADAISGNPPADEPQDPRFIETLATLAAHYDDFIDEVKKKDYLSMKEKVKKTQPLLERSVVIQERKLALEENCLGKAAPQLIATLDKIKDIYFKLEALLDERDLTPKARLDERERLLKKREPILLRLIELRQKHGAEKDLPLLLENMQNLNSAYSELEGIVKISDLILQAKLAEREQILKKREPVLLRLIELRQKHGAEKDLPLLINDLHNLNYVYGELEKIAKISNLPLQKKLAEREQILNKREQVAIRCLAFAEQYRGRNSLELLESCLREVLSCLNCKLNFKVEHFANIPSNLITTLEQIYAIDSKLEKLVNESTLPAAEKNAKEQDVLKGAMLHWEYKLDLEKKYLASNPSRLITTLTQLNDIYIKLENLVAEDNFSVIEKNNKQQALLQKSISLLAQKLMLERRHLVGDQSKLIATLTQLSDVYIKWEELVNASDLGPEIKLSERQRLLRECKEFALEWYDLIAMRGNDPSLLFEPLRIIFYIYEGLEKIVAKSERQQLLQQCEEFSVLVYKKSAATIEAAVLGFFAIHGLLKIKSNILTRQDMQSVAKLLNIKYLPWAKTNEQDRDAKDIVMLTRLVEEVFITLKTFQDAKLEITADLIIYCQHKAVGKDTIAITHALNYIEGLYGNKTNLARIKAALNAFAIPEPLELFFADKKISLSDKLDIYIASEAEIVQEDHAVILTGALQTINTLEKSGLELTAGLAQACANKAIALHYERNRDLGKAESYRNKAVTCTIAYLKGSSNAEVVSPSKVKWLKVLAGQSLLAIKEFEHFKYCFANYKMPTIDRFIILKTIINKISKSDPGRNDHIKLLLSLEIYKDPKILGPDIRERWDNLQGKLDKIGDLGELVNKTQENVKKLSAYIDNNMFSADLMQFSWWLAIAQCLKNKKTEQGINSEIVGEDIKQAMNIAKECVKKYTKDVLINFYCHDSDVKKQAAQLFGLIEDTNTQITVRVPSLAEGIKAKRSNKDERITAVLASLPVSAATSASASPSIVERRQSKPDVITMPTASSVSAMSLFGQGDKGMGQHQQNCRRPTSTMEAQT